MRAMMTWPEPIGHAARCIRAKWAAQGILRKKTAEAESDDEAAHLSVVPSSKRPRDESAPPESAEEPASQRHKMEPLVHQQEAAMGAMEPSVGQQDAGLITKPDTIYQLDALWLLLGGNCPDAQTVQATGDWLPSYVQSVTGEHGQPDAAANVDGAPQCGATVAHNSTADPTRRRPTAPMAFRPQQRPTSTETAATSEPAAQPATPAEGPAEEPAEGPARIDEDEAAYTQPGKARVARSTQPSSTALYLAQKRQQVAAEPPKPPKPQAKPKPKTAPLMRKAMRLYGKKKKAAAT